MGRFDGGYNDCDDGKCEYGVIGEVPVKENDEGVKGSLITCWSGGHEAQFLPFSECRSWLR